MNKAQEKRQALMMANRELMEHLGAIDSMTRNGILGAVEIRKKGLENVGKNPGPNLWKSLKNRQASLAEIQIIYEESEKKGFSKELTKKARELVS
jgi:hypothetical protein